MCSQYYYIHSASQTLHNQGKIYICDADFMYKGVGVHCGQIKKQSNLSWTDPSV